MDDDHYRALSDIAAALSLLDNGKITAFNAHTRIGNALSSAGMKWDRDKKLYSFPNADELGLPLWAEVPGSDPDPGAL